MSYIKRHVTKNTETFIPKNPEKYKGKMPILVRSGWEKSFCKWLDGNQKVIKWGSEEVSIKYRDPIKPIDKNGRPHFRNYYPDFIIQFDDNSTWLVEIKPYKETRQPIHSKKKSKSTMLNEERTWRINKAKWEAAQRYCNLKGWNWKILTEKELFS